MLKTTLIVIFSVTVKTNSWVFNDVDFSILEARNLTLDDFDVEFDDDLLQPRFNLIFPGTKWCGAGDIADNYDDLGELEEEDKCCREHDNCPDTIPAGETKYNLTNDAFYTRLSCECDEKFRRCLRQVNSKTSAIIGKMYFNALSTKCFRQDYPIAGCKKKGGWLNSKCLEYRYNTDGQKKYQWFDVPNY